MYEDRSHRTQNCDHTAVAIFKIFFGFNVLGRVYFGEREKNGRGVGGANILNTVASRNYLATFDSQHSAVGLGHSIFPAFLAVVGWVVANPFSTWRLHVA